MSTPKEKPNAWYALDVELEAAAREAVEYALMEAGALGTETGTRRLVIHVTGYFADSPERERVRDELFEALRIYELPSSSVRDMSVREVEERDWLESGNRAGSRSRLGASSSRRRGPTSPTVTIVVIRIEPGMAFGTGTHETTRLCLDAIQKHFSGGSFLDVGTGTGILAIAAAKLFPEARIEACDTDEAAVAIARENAAANGVVGPDRLPHRIR